MTEYIDIALSDLVLMFDLNLSQCHKVKGQGQICIQVKSLFEQLILKEQMDLNEAFCNGQLCSEA